MATRRRSALAACAAGSQSGSVCARNLRGARAKERPNRASRRRRFSWTGRTRLGPFAVLLELPDPPLDEIALEGAQPVDESRSVEMIDLVAERAGEKTFAFDFVDLPIDVARSHARPRRPLNTLREA